jgi:phage recombination protein Bet
MNQAVSNHPERRSVIADMAAQYGMETSAFEATVRATCIKPDKNGRVATREEFAAFLLVAKQYRLNPLTKEIYAFTDKGVVFPIVGIDGWSNLINSHPQFDGMDFDDKDNGNGGLDSITCKMFRKDRAHPVTVREYMAECARDTIPWNKWPRRMLRHKAMIQAARYAFGFAGIYDPDEGERILEARAARNVMTSVTQITQTAKRRAPNPNAPSVAAPAETKPQPKLQAAAFDFDKFRAALRAAATQDEANAIYDREVTNRSPALSGDDVDECDAILREEAARFWNDEVE